MQNIRVIRVIRVIPVSYTHLFISWLMRIAHNVIIDGYRSQCVFRMVEQGNDNDLSCLRGEDFQADCAEQEMVRKQVLRDVKKLVDFLPAPQREVVYMRYYQQMSFKDIAECTNVSLNTSLGRMRYALLNLRKMAKEHNIYHAVSYTHLFATIINIINAINTG